MTDAQPTMTFLEAIRAAFTKFADFSGRATRSEFWWFALFYGLVLSLCNVFVFVTLADGVTLGSVLASIWAIIVLLPSLAVSVRRLRDSGDGWKNIFWLLIPVAGIIILLFYWAHPTAPDSPGTPSSR